MPLIDCPVCGHEISDEAEACPQCGHPNRFKRQTAPAAMCYLCGFPATTRCQQCNALSCVQHVRSMYVSHGRGGANELLCENCYAAAKRWDVVGLFFAVIVIAIFAIIALTLFSWH